MPLAITNPCPCCECRPLLDDDTDGICAYCATYAENDIINELKAQTAARPMSPGNKNAAASLRSEHHRFFGPQNVSIDVMDSFFYGGDIDTMVHLIDFENAHD